MKQYKGTDNLVYEYSEDGSQDRFIPAGYVLITKEEADLIRFAPLPVSEQRKTMECFSWQLKRSLSQLGIRQLVEEAIISADQDTKDMWTDARTFYRLHPLVTSIQQSLGKTDEEVDQIFILAQTLT